MVSWSAKGSILEAPGFEFEWFWDAPGQVLEGAGFIFDFFFKTYGPHIWRSILDACCEGPPSKFVRPHNVLCDFDTWTNALMDAQLDKRLWLVAVALAAIGVALALCLWRLPWSWLWIS